MQQPTPASANQWVDTRMADVNVEPVDEGTESHRLWRGFMVARLSLALVLVVLHGGILALDSAPGMRGLGLSLFYLVACVVAQRWLQPKPLGQQFDRQWLLTVGVDVLVFFSLQTLPGSSVNYTPLFALPILMAAILSSMTMALGTAALVTLLLFANTGWRGLESPGAAHALLLQAALTGTGYFVMSFLASQLAGKLIASERLAERNRRAAEVQRHINALVIESLNDGLLVADQRGLVRLTNPAARHMLGYSADDRPLRLTPGGSWQSLLDLLKLSFASQRAQSADIELHHAGEGERRLWVQTHLTAVPTGGQERLCVMFIQDQRELQARMRTEKMASMGRMSAAVAHEIRNPLSAITQANALLSEDLQDPGMLKLSGIVQQNAQRLEKTVQDILDLTQASPTQPRELRLADAVSTICQEWQTQRRLAGKIELSLAEAQEVRVAFEPEHLRRILVNLLDNAWRHASQQDACIWVRCNVMGQQTRAVAQVHVWSDGAPLEPSVERHLFEPFFSSQSRSSGLGLYICRELCERNRATIAFRRSEHHHHQRSLVGNDFYISMGALSQATSNNTSQAKPA